MTHNILRFLTPMHARYVDDGFDPTMIPGLAAWYDASDITTITQSGGSVSQWDDKSGNDRHLVQATGARQPTYGDNVISFNGATQFLANASPFMWAAGEITYFVVVDNVTTEGALPNESSSSDNDPVYMPEGLAGANQGFIRNDSGTTILNQVQTIAYNDGDAHVVTSLDTGSNLTNYIDGVESISGNYTRSGTLTLNQFALGVLARSAPSQDLAGDVKEIVIYTMAMDADSRAQVEDYLNTKWGI